MQYLEYTHLSLAVMSGHNRTSFGVEVVKPWNSLSQEVVISPSISLWRTSTERTSRWNLVTRKNFL